MPSSNSTKQSAGASKAADTYFWDSWGMRIIPCVVCCYCIMMYSILAKLFDVLKDSNTVAITLKCYVSYNRCTNNC